MNVPTPHYVIDAGLLILTAVRYLWGPPTDLTRLGLLVCAFTLVMSDMDVYYNLEPFTFSFGKLGEIPIVKGLLGLFITADLVRDYILNRHRTSLGNWAERKQK